MQLLPENRDGIGAIPMTIYPMQAAASSVAAVGSISAVGTQTVSGAYYVEVNEIRSESFVISAGELGTALDARIAQAVNAIIEMPMTATSGSNTATLTAKWKGTSSNGLKIKVVGPSNGITFAITQPAGGLINPDISPALAQMGDVWESMLLNCFEISDTTTLDKIQAHGDGRWGALTRKPYVCFTGNTIANRTLACAVSAVRKYDKINGQLPAPGSLDLPFVVAARQLARIVAMANSNPPHDYGSLQATGIAPGLDSEQWDYTARDAAIKDGSSSVESRDGIIFIKDVVTFYHPDANPNPEFRYVVDIVKIQNVLYNLDRRFNNAEWDGAPLMKDGEYTTNRTAKFPRTAKIEAADMCTQLGLQAILTDVKATNATIQASVNDQNPKRLDMVLPITLVGNANIFSIDLLFSFYFGQAQLLDQ